MKPSRAVIVAAGRSSRLYPLTAEKPKGLLEIGDEPMLLRSIRLLRENGVSQIAVVVGFQSEAMRSHLGDDVVFVNNPFFRECNNMGSLMMARAFAEDLPFVYLHGDLVYSGSMLSDFLRAASNRGESILDLLVDFATVDEEAMKVRVDDRGRLIESHKAIPLSEAAGEWTGIAVVHNPQVVFDAIEQHMMNVSLTDYDTAAFSALAAGGFQVRCLPAIPGPWKEIDTLGDLEAARALFQGTP